MYAAEVVEASASLDTTQILVALIGAIGLIIVGWWQWGKKDKKAAVAEAKADHAEQYMNISETAIAKVAERSLELMQSIIDGLKTDNEKLSEKLDEAVREGLIKDGIITELKRQLDDRDERIRELEHELERLRGRLDAIVRRQEDSDSGKR